MLDIAAALISACQDAIALGKTLHEWLPEDFSEREREILFAARRRGYFLVVEVEPSGNVVMADETDFSDDNDPAYAAHYLEAFTKLCTRGLVVPEGESFRLTGSGFDLARKIADQSDF